VNDITLQKVTAELEKALSGQRFGRVFALSRFQMAIDLRLAGSLFLFIGFEPANPRIYLIKRRLRDIEKQSGTPTVFALTLKKRLSGATLEHVEKIRGERVLRLLLSGADDLGNEKHYTLIVQLTGRSANLFLLDHDGIILDSARETTGDGQETGNHYSPPRREGERNLVDDELFTFRGFETLSEALDRHYLEQDLEKRFQSRAAAARARLKQDLAKREKLAAKLRADLENHGDAEKWKRCGDLLLANTGTARREGGSIFVIDFYDENTPEIEIAVDENLSITDAAGKFFKRYTKARNAAVEIEKRLTSVRDEIEKLAARKDRLEAAIEARDEEFLEEFSGKVKEPSRGQKKKAPEFTGARRFSSSDGFEILVGKASKDNDYLTFRIAKSFDLWMHAADYPGSHVVVKNPNRQEIPAKTLVEAAQIAAFYSHARQQPKAAVHYTQKKFVNKPKGAAPGLVSLSSFKTILVEPRIEVEPIR
jgi:predicted ribosome quality control (RQC) complex YloA/Tae2 family protein